MGKSGEGRSCTHERGEGAPPPPLFPSGSANAIRVGCPRGQGMDFNDSSPPVTGINQRHGHLAGACYV